MHCNPFLAERVAHEREALGADFVPYEAIWHARADREVQNPNLEHLNRRVETMAESLRVRIAKTTLGDDERGLYEDLVLYLFYARFEERLWRLAAGPSDGARRVSSTAFRARRRALLAVPGVAVTDGDDTAHLFACLYQVRRAFHHTFRAIIGGSLPAARLRAERLAVDLHARPAALPAGAVRRMGDITTLSRPVGHRQGAGRARHRPVALHPVRPASRRLREDAGGVLPAESLGAVADADRVRAVRPPARRVHRRGRGPRRLARSRARRTGPCSSTRSASSSRRSR